MTSGNLTVTFIFINRCGQEDKQVANLGITIPECATIKDLIELIITDSGTQNVIAPYGTAEQLLKKIAWVVINGTQYNLCDKVPIDIIFLYRFELTLDKINTADYYAFLGLGKILCCEWSDSPSQILSPPNGNEIEKNKK